MAYGIKIEGEKARALVWQKLRENRWPADAFHVNDAAAQLGNERILRIKLSSTGRGFVATLAEKEKNTQRL